MSRLQAVYVAATQSKRRLLIFSLALIVILCGLYYIFKSKSLPEGVTLYASDIVATNVQQVTSSGDSGVFFTGTNAAKLTITSGKTTSSALLKEIPYENPQRFQYDNDSGTLLVSVNYTGYNPLFKLGDLKPGLYWVITSRDSGAKVLNPNLNQTVDARIAGGYIYGITNEGENYYNLYRYDIESGKTSSILEGMNSNRIVGATKDRIITQDSSGLVYIYDGSGTQVGSIDRPGSITFDAHSNLLIAANNDKQRKGYQLTIYDASGRKLRSRSTPYRYVFVSKGFIYGLDDKTRPTRIAIYKQGTLEGKLHPLNLSSNPSNDSLANIVTLKNNPLVIGLVGSSNTISLSSSDKSYIDKIPVFQYPYLSTDQAGNTVIQAQKGSTDVTLITSNLSDLSESVNDLKTSCDCDTNQLNKSWRSTQTTTEQYE